MGISRNAFEDIASIAADSLKGVTVVNKKGGIFKVTKPVKAVFRNDGKVEINIEVALNKGDPVHDICVRIQETIANAISMMAETVPVSISVHVTKIH